MVKKVLAPDAQAEDIIVPRYGREGGVYCRCEAEYSQRCLGESRVRGESRRLNMASRLGCGSGEFERKTERCTEREGPK